MIISFKTTVVALLACICGTGNLAAQENNELINKGIMEEKLNLTQESK